MRKIMNPCLVCCLGLCLASAPVRADEAEDKAALAVTKLGGRVTRDNTAAGKPVVEVNFTGVAPEESGIVAIIRSVAGDVVGAGKTTDAGLKALHGLKSLRKLDLGYTRVTDAGLAELKGLKELRSLNLMGTRVTGVGLKQLEGLQTLNLSTSRVTDEGLKGLKELKTLRLLSIVSTKVTDAGVRGIQAALPELVIGR